MLQKGTASKNIQDELSAKRTRKELAKRILMPSAISAIDALIKNIENKDSEAMSESSNKHLAKVIADVAVFLEFTAADCWIQTLQLMHWIKWHQSYN
ncbi:MAG TPA: hypothetical protein VFF75_09010 [Methylophilaceae bacterium]|nr:hypothetical protein [Methylophilaceae bacterium]